ncbi:extracellular solute-binding protein [Ketogulonicigenium vulgare Y25]|uniref:Multiple sugar ABC transporter substrate-binding protein n=1 Tax=Ketogulonicigenium vulgare (strain WSH-001) TaxID=759362 RepID=F9Y4W1_KETVW|nr:extracellular solute-binding protein [Ketogulonicigenium vulgare]ADO43569.1 extracellular solute-binding protein [Ketogulonicigenium vulgare Y25]AEM41845.1 multiple sugar ABC transporter substrate-binding protein [Ketogulonicigenium vulgare WSH-001]ALJ81951.1 sugar ABC transporter substrate-binding protein [Ketogulonicigenium vulgare]AOZ55603.1 extracellular solute-binding protein [Ketogulonicigenium vulgare]
MKNLFRTTAIALVGFSAAAPAFAQELSFWSWRQEDRAVYEDIISDFEAANPGITVNFETFEATNYNTILSTALAGDAGPDVMMVRAHGGLEMVASGGYLMPLSTESVPGVAGFPESALAAETLRSDETLYAVPFASQTQFILYNKGLFDQMGLSEPQTWDDLIATSEALKAAGLFAFGNGTGTAWQAETIATAIIASVIGKDFYDDLLAGNADFTDPRYVGGLEKLQEISAYFPDGFTGLDYAASQLLFTSGLAGMFAGGSYEVANFLAQNPDIEVGVFAAPGLAAEDPKLVGVYYDGGYAGNATTEHPEAVLTFLNYLTTVEFGQKFANELGNITPIPGVTFENPMLQRVSDLNQSSVPYIMLTNFRFGEPTGSVLLQAEVQRMFAGQIDAAGAGQAITTGLAAWYAPFQQ